MRNKQVIPFGFYQNTNISAFQHKYFWLNIFLTPPIFATIQSGQRINTSLYKMCFSSQTIFRQLQNIVICPVLRVQVEVGALHTSYLSFRCQLFQIEHKQTNISIFGGVFFFWFLVFFFVVFGCKYLGLKNPACVKEMTNMRYALKSRWYKAPYIIFVFSFTHAGLFNPKVLQYLAWQNHQIKTKSKMTKFDKFL